MPQKQRRIKAIFYNNPDGYPPIVNSSRLLAQAGLGIDLFCRADGANWNVFYPERVKVHRIQGRTGSSLQEYAGFLSTILRRHHRNTAVFVGHDMHGLLPARLLATLYRRPLIYHCHDYINADDAQQIATRGVRLVRAFEQRFARTADLVIVPDAERGAVMQRELGLKQPPLTVANAPLRDSTSQEKLPGTVLIQALARQGKHFERILFRQGRIGVGHAIEATLRSIQYWQDKKWGFVLMGPVESSYLEELTQLALSLGVQEQFAILPPVGYDEVLNYTREANVGHALYQPIHINNIHITTASNKIMEYMAAGLPLLVSSRPGLQSLIEENQCGLAADEDSPESIAAAVNVLMKDEEQSLHMGKNALRAFDRNFCYEIQFGKAVERIEDLLRR